MRFQFWSMYEDSRVEDFIEGFYCSSMFSCLHQECCGSGQYNLPDKMFGLDANTTLNQSYVRFITLINITYQSRDQYFPSNHFWDSSPWQVLYILLFCFVSVFWVVLVFFQMCSKPNQFLIQIKVYFYIILCFLNWNCRVIIHNFMTFLTFPKDLQCSSFISILTLLRIDPSVLGDILHNVMFLFLYLSLFLCNILT